jgi:hypothetical protein
MGALSHGPRSLPPFRFCQAPWKSEALAERKQPRFPDRRNDLRSRDERAVAEPASRRTDCLQGTVRKRRPKGSVHLSSENDQALGGFAIPPRHDRPARPPDDDGERAAFYEWKRLTDAGDPHPAGQGGSLHRRFKKIFAKYEAFGEADALRQILGSTPRDVGAFPFTVAA